MPSASEHAGSSSISQKPKPAPTLPLRPSAGFTAQSFMSADPACDGLLEQGISDEARTRIGAAAEALVREGRMHYRNPTPNHPNSPAEYERARAWGYRARVHSTFPAAIAEPTTVDEVSALVKWAVAEKLSISVTNGGHSGLGFASTVVIKMERMNAVEVDGQTVTCGGGALVRMVDAACEPLGLATTLGNCGMVGVTGALLGGGTGFMARWQGLTVDQLIRATVVLADGSVVEASAEQNPDLFYALRGGGGNFGVVVSLTLRLFRVGWDDGRGSARLVGGMRVCFKNRVGFGGNRGGLLGTLTRFREYADSAPDQVSVEMMIPFAAPVAVQFLTFKGPISEGKREAVQWRRRLGRPLLSLIGTKSYFKMQGFVQKVAGSQMRKGASERWTAMLAGALPDAALEILASAGRVAPKNASMIIQRLGGKIERPDGGVDGSAFAHRLARYWINLNVVTSRRPGKGEDPSRGAAAVTWLNNTCRALQPHIITAEGVGLIAPATDQPLDSPAPKPMVPVNVFGSAARIEKLRMIKRKFDPDNVFSAVQSGITGAHNIDPAAEAGQEQAIAQEELGGAIAVKPECVEYTVA